MRTIITIATLLLVAQLYAQDKVQPQVEKQRSSKVETSKSVDITRDLFLSKEIPSDFPNLSGKEVEVQQKIIQGYINVYSHLIDKVEALKLGYTFPENMKPEDADKRRAMQDERHRRTVPVDPQESRDNQ